jgi:hypothetical protein
MFHAYFVSPVYVYTVLGELAQKFEIIPYNEATQAYVIDYKQVNTGNIDYIVIATASTVFVVSLTSLTDDKMFDESNMPFVVLVSTYV